MSFAGLDALKRGFDQAPEVTRRELLAAATQGTLLVEREVKDGMPRHTGMTAASVASDAFSTPVGVIGTVGSSQPSATFLELGTKPHMPPVEALIPWVKAVLGVEPKRARSVAFLVARKIARKGTKPRRVFEKAAAATEGQVLRMFEDAAGRVAAHLGGGAV
ncbi:MAG: hypothetical protein K2X78_01235 [Burkholderiaceae bacterium]|nr:hypothetical protein [Burkholderiaceae bacterium]